MQSSISLCNPNADGSPAKKIQCDGARPTCGECIQRSEIRCRYPYVPRREEHHQQQRAAGYSQQPPQHGMREMEGNREFRSPASRAAVREVGARSGTRRGEQGYYGGEMGGSEAPRQFGDIDALLAAPFLAGEAAEGEGGWVGGEEEEDGGMGGESAGWGDGFGDGLG